MAIDDGEAVEGGPVGHPAAPGEAWHSHGFAGVAADLVGAGTLPRAWAARWASAPGAPVLAGPEGRWVTAAELDERTA
ncbi:MAG: hypothetical protein ACRD0R_17705, partial [Acidimicrobiales bacterium]